MIGTKIKKARTEKGYSQEYMADVLDIAQSTFHYIESGKSKPDIDLLKKIADVLETDIYDLIESKKLKQINNDNAVGYQAEVQHFNISEKVIKLYEDTISDLKQNIFELKEEIKALKSK